ncbi:hypothetical protein LX15_001635 [Streptoalloteichus tenebrarius]|uniref:Uncharacterized protein n=1 Tax=Streptoalloteichus tenebrarius (strain ATCC 17920 / DSM 40477 / JCM 4838 / CBS 697.72 / NBRC 16177 / NCIMB 11028 / NRRL B-12390 / A12253. 1 / ISP 5477) TaxID=1933 RepID=A0ABT1HR35_STRSD|nr:hypothetical protein [Streptoalloteichus tenebrarius]
MRSAEQRRIADCRTRGPDRLRAGGLIRFPADLPVSRPTLPALVAPVLRPSPEREAGSDPGRARSGRRTEDQAGQRTRRGPFRDPERPSSAAGAACGNRTHDLRITSSAGGRSPSSANVPPLVGGVVVDARERGGSGTNCNPNCNPDQGSDLRCCVSQTSSHLPRCTRWRRSRGPPAWLRVPRRPGPRRTRSRCPRAPHGRWQAGPRPARQRSPRPPEHGDHPRDRHGLVPVPGRALASGAARRRPAGALRHPVPLLRGSARPDASAARPVPRPLRTGPWPGRRSTARRRPAARLDPVERNSATSCRGACSSHGGGDRSWWGCSRSPHPDGWLRCRCGGAGELGAGVGAGEAG